MAGPREPRAGTVTEGALPGPHSYHEVVWRLEHSYADLPALFHAPATPTPVRHPQLVVFNSPLAAELGLDATRLNSPEGAAIFAGNTLPEGARPLAQAYAGHQFGHFTALGDGRAILLGEQVTTGGARVDIQLKGAGQTPYSRRGDGRAALGPMLREYILGEAMHALGIPTSRSLAVVATGEPVVRERLLPGAVLTRVAASHLRVGTFEWAAAHRDTAALRALADYSVRRHYPEAAAAAHPHLALFDAVVERQAALLAKWQLVGFIHGVMNTDNMSLAGETLDYGPCAFMDTYDPATVFSSIDQQGRYAYANQPAIAQWNLARLAEAMLPLFDADQARAAELANAAIERFASLFERHWLAGMRAKLGLFTEDRDDQDLIDGLLGWMHRRQADFTNTFRSLSPGTLRPDTTAADEELRAWHDRWQTRLRRQPQPADEARGLMRRRNPAVIPRNHRVEAALEAAARGDLDVLRRLMAVLVSPFDAAHEATEFSAPPASGGRGYLTFCGT
jgi:serine/tyrosine/threonine adenylyltransferase